MGTCRSSLHVGLVYMLLIDLLGYTVDWFFIRNDRGLKRYAFVHCACVLKKTLTFKVTMYIEEKTRRIILLCRYILVWQEILDTNSI